MKTASKTAVTVSVTVVMVLMELVYWVVKMVSENLSV